MTPKERNEIRDLAAGKHKGNVDAAVCDWLGLGAEFKAAKGVPEGNAGAVYNIKDELEKYEDLDAEESKAAAAAVTAAPTTAAVKGENADAAGGNGGSADGGSGN